MSIDAPIRSPDTFARILVVDGNNLYGKVISFKLREAGYQVATAMDGAAAISVARAERPDLIVMDIAFPPEVSGLATDGFGILEWLHHLDGCENIPFIFITGNHDLKTRERAMGLGAAAFLHKPVNHDDLLRAIRTALDVSKPA